MNPYQILPAAVGPLIAKRLGCKTEYDLNGTTLHPELFGQVHSVRAPFWIRREGAVIAEANLAAEDDDLRKASVQLVTEAVWRAVITGGTVVITKIGRHRQENGKVVGTLGALHRSLETLAQTTEDMSVKVLLENAPAAWGYFGLPLWSEFAGETSGLSLDVGHASVDYGLSEKLHELLDQPYLKHVTWSDAAYNRPHLELGTGRIDKKVHNKIASLRVAKLLWLDPEALALEPLSTAERVVRTAAQLTPATLQAPAGGVGLRARLLAAR